MNWWLLAPAVVLALAAYVCVAWEWQFLLQPVGPFPFRRSAQAVFAGRFANDVLPMHIGYLVRAFVAARALGCGLTAIAPSLMMERLWDGFWLAAATGALSLTVPLPGAVIAARNAVALLVFAGVFAMAAIAMLPGRQWLPARIKILFDRVADGMRGLVRGRLFATVLVLSLVKLAVQAAAILVLLRAAGIDVSLTKGLAVFVAGYLATCVPAAPAGAGLFQVFVVAALENFGIGRPEAAGFSIVSFIVLTVPPAVAGYFALAGSGLTFRQVRVGIGSLK
jgi:uncharacterized protein (TIRG00374 family)